MNRNAKSFFIYLSRLFLILAIVLSVFIFFLPTLINTNWGRKQSLLAINSLIPGSLDVRSWQLHWGKPQIMEGVILKDSEGQSVLEIGRLSIDAPLWSFFTKQINLDTAHIQEMKANLTLSRHSWINLDKALGISQDREESDSFSFELSHVNAKFQLFTNDHPFFIWSEGVVKQQELKGSFDFFLQLNELHASNWKELKAKVQQDFEEIREDALQLNLQHFPTKLLDHFSQLEEKRYQTLFQSFLGDHVNLMIKKTQSSENLLVSIQAPFMEGGFKGNLHEKSFTLLEPATFHFDLTPEIINTLTKSQIQLQKSMPTQVIFPYFSFPLALLSQPASVDFCQCGFKIDAAIGSIDMKIRPIGIVNVHHLEAQIVSSAKDSQMHFKATGYVEYFQKPLHINFERWFKKPTNFAAFLKKPKLENVSAVMPSSK